LWLILTEHAKMGLAKGCLRCILGVTNVILLVSAVRINSLYVLKLWRILHNVKIKHFSNTFLPRSMECRRGLAMKILSVGLSICLSVGQTHDL